MRYRSGMKAAIFKRILPPTNESVTDVSRDTGVNTATISYWKKQAADGMLDLGDGHVRPRDRSAGEKLTLLLESKTVTAEEHGEWLRSRGLHSEHLPLWEQELRWRCGGSEDRRTTAPRRIVRKLADEERDHIAEVCCRPEYADVSPYAIYADLLDEGIYLASVSTMYRILRERPGHRTLNVGPTDK